MSELRWTRSPGRILHFDTECRPLSYIGNDYTSGEITAIAAGWAGKRPIHVWLLGVDEPLRMLEGFLELYDQADIVTGHYIRKHDLPILSGAMLEFGLGRLPSKLTSDTQADLVKHKYLSASQESLAVMKELSAGKVHMTQPGWREANRLTEPGIEKSRRRVVGDVRQHKQLRSRLLEEGVLAPPKLWKAFR